MGKNDTLLMVGGFILAAVVLGNILKDGGSSTVIDGDTGETDLSQVVSPTAKFTGERMFQTGTALTSEWVEVYTKDTEPKEIDTISMNAGTLALTPNANYRLYFGRNSTTYYAQPKDYVGPNQEGTTPVVGTECLIDTTPVIATFDEYGQVQSSSVNVQTLAASGEYPVSVQIKASARECWGNPNVAITNAMCLKYNSSAYTYVKAKTAAPVSTPYSISSAYAATGYNIDCFAQKLLKDNEKEMIDVNIKTSSSWADTTNVNITVYLDDAAIDVDQLTNKEIVGYEDEDKNALGYTSVPTAGTIQIT